MVYKLVNIKQVIAKILRDLGLNKSNQEFSDQDFIEWIAEGLSYIDSYNQLEQKSASIDVEDFKGKLPCDFYRLIRINNGYSFGDYSGNLIAEDCDPTQLQNKISKVNYSNAGYNINFDTLTTAYRTGKVSIQYLAIPVDEEGYPKIPDDVSVFNCLFWRVVYHLSIQGFTFKNPQLNDINFCSRKKDFYTMQARGTLNMPDGDMLERMKNRWLSLIPNTNAYSSGFSDYHGPQNINLMGKS